VTSCPACGIANPSGAKFCNECAAPLAARPGGMEERKTVTILFCDLVGFTAMSEAADPEDVEAVLGRYHDAARRVIQHHGGIVEKYIGDAVVGVFGVPAVHEDDPERAVRAGLRVLEALDGMARPDGKPLQARVGINTGEALVRLDVDPASGRGFLTGDAVNTAARLQAAAPPMGVVAGGATHAATRDVIVYEALPPAKVKGKATPLEFWRALEARSQTGHRTALQVSTPLVGREAELDELLAGFMAVGTDRHGEARLIVGEPGIGKSRLVLELARALEASSEFVVWRQGRCVPYGEGVTFWPLSELLKEHAGVLDSDDVATVEAKLEAVVPEVEDRAWLRRRLRPLLGLDASPAGRDENFAAWARFIELLASSRPAVVVIEDIHWAGDTMLGFLDYLVSRRLAVPLLILLTARPEALGRLTGRLASEDIAGCPRLVLRSLSGEESSVLIEALAAARLDPADAEHIAGLAGGNPLYAEQYVRLLLDRGCSAPIEGGMQTAPPRQLPLPETVHAVLAARVDTLSAEQKGVLCAAAVLGETFWSGAVAVVTDLDTPAVEAALETLIERELVRPAASSTVEGEREYLFWHALARDVAYGLLPRRSRASRHLAAGRWLEEQTGDRVGEFSEILVHHYDTGLGFARAAGDEELAEALRAAAVDAYVLAGERALRLDVAAAEKLCARGLELAGPDAPQRARLTQYWAQALWLRRRYTDAAAAYREAIAMYRARGEIRRAAIAMAHLVSVLTWLAESCFDVLKEAVVSLEDDEPSPEKAEVLGLYALGLMLAEEDWESVIGAADEAVVMCQHLDLPEPAMALSCRGFARVQHGDPDGVRDCERAMAAAREQGLGVERATIELNAADLVFATRGAPARLDCLAATMEFARRSGLAAYFTTSRGALVHAHVASGNWTEALREVDLLIEEHLAADELWDLLVMRALWALLLAWRGEESRVALVLPWLLERGRESEVLWTRSFVAYAAACVELRLGNRTAALELLEEALADPGALVTAPDDLAEMVRMMLKAAGVYRTRRLTAQLFALMPVTPMPLQEHAAVTVGAQLAEAEGELEQAAAGFADAARRWHDFGVPYEEGHALLGQGRCLVALGRTPEAAAPLAAAREVFARLGARPALAETEKWLAEALPV
jgi:class 3 adenylate cyclase